MASQIYSRYVPPAKTPTLELVPTTTIYTPPTSKHDASSTYTRYIPHPKPKQNADYKDVQDNLALQLPKRKLSGLVSGEESNTKKAKKTKQSPNDIGSRIYKGRDEDVGQGSIPRKLSSGNHSRDEDVGQENIQRPEATAGKTSPVLEDIRHKKVLEKREKSLKRGRQLAIAERESDENMENDGIPESTETHDLVPLPQPEPTSELSNPYAQPSSPPWLAYPIRVRPTATASFVSLGVPEDVANTLQSKGFEEAFAIQATVLPLLLPGSEQQLGDVLISAATGSGKTLAYALPMIENICRNTITRLRGLIIVPTRELVTQAQEICQVCAAAFSTRGRKRVKIGSAVGSNTFKMEQDILMEQELRYDPIESTKQNTRLNAKWETSDRESEEDDDFCDDEIVSDLPDHVIEGVSGVDILICTPGRLVEHLRSTPGFSLEYVRWLIVDEADKLLDQSFQQWSDLVVARLIQNSNFDRVRKVILSATMTRDIGKLNTLKLYRPNLIVLEGSSNNAENGNKSLDVHTLPALLLESAIKVDDESIKPLYLMQLLVMNNFIRNDTRDLAIKSVDISSSEDETFTGDSSDETKSPSDSESEGTQKAMDLTQDVLKVENFDLHKATRGVLIFTKSNESAIRLSRLIAILQPEYTHSIGTLTSTTRKYTRKATLNLFQSGKLSIIIASDLVSRGLDLPNLAHVINYDIPTSVTSYVHRVGRTARAGKKGHAWTLLTNTEARWFWTEIGRSTTIERAEKSKVMRVKMDIASFDIERDRYEKALSILGDEARVSKE
ncbi:hypothetical protein B7494_g8292 [Chlorociboria aeruginascens]|nr:hypothetical protein B7494_g8292 [Chlorociboria aeruginascens]